MPICRFAAEPPQGGLPPEETLQAEFLAACLRVETEDGRSRPRRGGRDPLVPRPHVVGPHLRARDRAHRHRAGALRLRVLLAARRRRRRELYAWADYTADVAEDHPEWRMDISQEVVGGWRGERGEVAAMTLIWGVPFERRGRIVDRRARARTTVDEAEIIGERFTLLAPDAYDDEYLDVVLQGRRRERAGARVALRGRRATVSRCRCRRCGRRRRGRSGRSPAPVAA